MGAPKVTTSVTVLEQPDGTDYPSRMEHVKRGGVVPDFETLRLDPHGSVWYASEGDRQLGLDHRATRAPQREISRAVCAAGAVRIFRDNRHGTAYDLTLESLTFAPDGNSVWTALEGPLLQDGELPTQTTGGTTRLTRMARDGKISRDAPT